jgi:putative transposase
MSYARILSAHYRPDAHSGGPSWLTFIGHMKDSLWSVDLFRCESAVLRTYWVLVVMDQFTRRIIGFGVQRGVVDGLALCRMFNRAIRGQAPPSMSARITIRCIGFSNGKPICASWT